MIYLRNDCDRESFHKEKAERNWTGVVSLSLFWRTCFKAKNAREK